MNGTKRKLQSVLAACFLAACFSSSASAALIFGELNTVGSVRVTATGIDFLPVGGGDGLFTVDPLAPQTGSFAGFQGDTGRTKDLNNTDQPVDDYNFTTGAGPLFNFMTFNNGSPITFTLRFIPSGSGTPAGCASGVANCTPPGSPFTLVPTGTDSSIVGFNVAGTVSDGSMSPESNFVGTFTTQFPTQSVQEVLAAFGPSGPGFIEKSYSATFNVTAIPEPGTMSLLLVGSLLTLVGGVSRKMTARK